MGKIGMGELERNVLLVIHHQQGRGYAVSIAGELKQRSGKSVALGAVYATAVRLEKKGLVSSKLGESTPARGGKPKRFYRLEAPGLLALADARAANERMWAGAPQLRARP